MPFLLTLLAISCLQDCPTIYKTAAHSSYGSSDRSPSWDLMTGRCLYHPWTLRQPFAGRSAPTIGRVPGGTASGRQCPQKSIFGQTHTSVHFHTTHPAVTYPDVPGRRPGMPLGSCAILTGGANSPTRTSDSGQGASLLEPSTPLTSFLVLAPAFPRL